MDPRFIDDLAQKLSEALPSGLRSVQRDLEGNFKAVLRSALSKLDLVTREEFDVQAAVLGRTRERLKAFESRIAAMEKQEAARVVRGATPSASKKTSAGKKTATRKTGKKTARKETVRKKTTK